MLGHICYIFVFLYDVDLVNIKVHMRGSVTRRKVACWMICSVWFFLLYTTIIPYLSLKFLLPVTVYCAVVATVMFTSLVPVYRFKWLAVAMLLYCGSDSLIALNMFVVDLGVISIFTWPLYYLSQLLFAVGFLVEKGKLNDPGTDLVDKVGGAKGEIKRRAIEVRKEWEKKKESAMGSVSALSGKIWRRINLPM